MAILIHIRRALRREPRTIDVTRVAEAVEPAPKPDPIASVEAAFDADYYLSQLTSGWDPYPSPFHHFLAEGWKTPGLDPTPDFSVQEYLAANADVRASGKNPFVHYVLHGKREGRRPKPLSGRPGRLPRYGRPGRTIGAGMGAGRSPVGQSRLQERPAISADDLFDLYLRRTFDRQAAVEIFERSVIAPVMREEAAHRHAQADEVVALNRGVEREIAIRRAQLQAMRRLAETGEAARGEPEARRADPAKVPAAVDG